MTVGPLTTQSRLYRSFVVILVELLPLGLSMFLTCYPEVGPSSHVELLRHRRTRPFQETHIAAACDHTLCVST